MALGAHLRVGALVPIAHAAPKRPLSQRAGTPSPVLRLFEQAEIDRWNAMFAAERAAEAAEGGGNGGAG